MKDSKEIKTVIIPMEFGVQKNSLFIRMTFANAEADGVKIGISIALNGAIVVSISKEGTDTVNYILTADTLGNSIYREWKETYLR